MRRPIASVFTAASLLAAAPAWAQAPVYRPGDGADPSAPVFVHQASVPLTNRAWLEKALQSSYLACQHKLGGSAPASAPLPDWGALQRVKMFEVKTYYDAGREARYTAERSVYADVDHGCQYVVHTRRTVEIAGLCARGDQWVRLARKVDENRLQIGEVTKGTWQQRCAPTATALASLQPSGDLSGHACLGLRSPALTSASAAARSPSKAVCFYARHPLYVFRDQAALVPIGTYDLPEDPVDGFHRAVITWVPQTIVVGKPLDAKMFTAEAAEAFVKREPIVALGAAGDD